MKNEMNDQIYSLKDGPEQRRRRAMLREPHMKPLTEYLERIRLENPRRELPSFDPCDGGIFAKAFFLLETPGRKAAGTGFISRNNPDPTAKNFFEFLQVAQIAREDTLVWNIVPWYVGGQEKISTINQTDIAEARPYIEELFAMLDNLKVVVLMGKSA